MTRVKLLRDLYIWAYEPSTQEDLEIKQKPAEPDPLRMAWCDVIRQTLLEVITHPEHDRLSGIRCSLGERVPEGEQQDVQALIVEEIRIGHCAAVSSAAMSIFFIVIIASIARLALSRSEPDVNSISRFGVICHE